MQSAAIYILGQLVCLSPMRTSVSVTRNAFSQLRDKLLRGGIEDDADLLDQRRLLFDEDCLEVYLQNSKQFFHPGKESMCKYQ